MFDRFTNLKMQAAVFALMIKLENSTSSKTMQHVDTASAQVFSGCKRGVWWVFLLNNSSCSQRKQQHLLKQCSVCLVWENV